MPKTLKNNNTTNLQQLTASIITVLISLFIIVTPNTIAAATKNKDVTFSNPNTIAKPYGYTHVVEVNGRYRTLYISGQLGLGLDGKLVGKPGDFKAQATQSFENIKAALDSADADFKDIVKINMYLTNINEHLPLLREIRDSYINTNNPPASTTVEVTKLALPNALFEIDAVVIVPLKP